MKRCSLAASLFAVAVLATALPQMVWATPDEPFKWYGVGGEITSDSGQPRRWLGRIGISDQMGAEVLFAMQHTSADCGQTDCDATRIDIGAGLIYDVAPAAAITPYCAGRFILTSVGDGESNTSGTIELAGGVEYVIMKRLGISGELDFTVRTDPSEIGTTTRVKFYFYF
jgi:hypothetical protein